MPENPRAMVMVIIIMIKIQVQYNVPFKDMISAALVLFSCFVALSHLMVMSWTRAYSRFGRALRVRFANRFRSARMWRREGWRR